MNTRKHLPTSTVTAQSASCHGASQGSTSTIGRRRGLALGAAATIAIVALGLSQHWFTFRDLLPLLYVLPCAAMMFMCMKGVNHRRQPGKAPSSGPDIVNK